MPIRPEDDPEYNRVRASLGSPTFTLPNKQKPSFGSRIKWVGDVTGFNSLLKGAATLAGTSYGIFKTVYHAPEALTGSSDAARSSARDKIKRAWMEAPQGKGIGEFVQDVVTDLGGDVRAGENVHAITYQLPGQREKVQYVKEGDLPQMENWAIGHNARINKNTVAYEPSLDTKLVLNYGPLVMDLLDPVQDLAFVATFGKLNKLGKAVRGTKGGTKTFEAMDKLGKAIVNHPIGKGSIASVYDKAALQLEGNRYIGTLLRRSAIKESELHDPLLRANQVFSHEIAVAHEASVKLIDGHPELINIGDEYLSLARKQTPDAVARKQELSDLAIHKYGMNTDALSLETQFEGHKFSRQLDPVMREAALMSAQAAHALDWISPETSKLGTLDEIVAEYQKVVNDGKPLSQARLKTIEEAVNLRTQAHEIGAAYGLPPNVVDSLARPQMVAALGEASGHTLETANDISTFMRLVTRRDSTAEATKILENLTRGKDGAVALAKIRVAQKLDLLNEPTRDRFLAAFTIAENLGSRKLVSRSVYETMKSSLRRMPTLSAVGDAIQDTAQKVARSTSKSGNFKAMQQAIIKSGARNEIDKLVTATAQQRGELIDQLATVWESRGWEKSAEILRTKARVPIDSIIMSPTKLADHFLKSLDPDDVSKMVMDDPVLQERLFGKVVAAAEETTTLPPVPIPKTGVKLADGWTYYGKLKGGEHSFKPPTGPRVRLPRSGSLTGMGRNPALVPDHIQAQAEQLWAASNRTSEVVVGGAGVPSTSEFFRWQNLSELVRSAEGKRLTSLDVSDNPAFYFSPFNGKQIGGSQSWVTNTYMRVTLDQSILKQAGWRQELGLRGEGAWIPTGDNKTVTKAYTDAIKQIEVDSLPTGKTIEDVAAIVKYRLGRDIPVVASPDFMDSKYLAAQKAAAKTTNVAADAARGITESPEELRLMIRQNLVDQIRPLQKSLIKSSMADVAGTVDINVEKMVDAVSKSMRTMIDYNVPGLHAKFTNIGVDLAPMLKQMEGVNLPENLKSLLAQQEVMLQMAEKAGLDRTGILTLARITGQAEDLLGRAKVDLGIISPESYAKLEGRHITQSYKVYDEDIRPELEALVASADPATKAKAERTLHLFEQWESKMLERESASGTHDTGAVSSSLAKRRNPMLEQHPEIRAILQQNDRADMSLIHAAQKNLRTIPMAAYYEMIANAPELAWFGSKLPKGMANQGWVQLADDVRPEFRGALKPFKNSSSWGALKGAWVPGWLANSLRNQARNAGGVDNGWIKAARAVTDITKILGVRSSPLAKLRNEASNVMAVRFGLELDSFPELAPIIVDAVKEFHNPTSQWMARLNHQTVTTARRGEAMISVTEDLERIADLATNEGGQSALFAAKRWVREWNGKSNDFLFGDNEAIAKLAIFKYSVEKMGLADHEAAALAEKWMVDYLNVPPIVDIMRRNLGLMPYITWSYKMFGNLARFTAKHPEILLSDWNKVRQWNDHIRPKEISDLEHEALPDYLQDQLMLYLPGPDKNKPIMMNIGYFFPHAMFNPNISEPTATEGTAPQIVAEVVMNNLSPLYSLAQSFIYNKNMLTGQEIVPQGASAEQKWQFQRDYALKQLTPAVRLGESVWKSIRNKPNSLSDPSITPYWASMIGAKRYDLDKSMELKLKRNQSDLQAQTALKSRLIEMYNQDPLPRTRHLMDTTSARIETLFQKQTELGNAALRIQGLRGVLRDAGVSDDNAAVFEKFIIDHNHDVDKWENMKVVEEAGKAGIPIDELLRRMHPNLVGGSPSTSLGAQTPPASTSQAVAPKAKAVRPRFDRSVSESASGQIKRTPTAGSVGAESRRHTPFTTRNEPTVPTFLP